MSNLVMVSMTCVARAVIGRAGGIGYG